MENNGTQYKITIEKIVTQTSLTTPSWQVVRQTDSGKDEYGYPPAIETTVQKELKIFEQTVDTLDIGAVVAVVNQLCEIK